MARAVNGCMAGAIVNRVKLRLAVWSNGPVSG